MRRDNRTLLAIVSAVVFTFAALWWFSRPSTDALQSVPAPLIPVSVLGVLLYLASHLFRAVRLAAIGVTVHRTSFRTLMLLNLSLAPWSLIVPFKLDELLRLYELRTLNGSLSRATVTVLIDRSMDGAALLLVSLLLFFGGKQDAAMIPAVVGLAMVAVTMGFFAAAQILSILQRYVFLYHYKPRALSILSVVQTLRGLVLLGRETITTAAPILILCTFAIWSLEIASVWVLAAALSEVPVGFSGAVYSTLSRANSSWSAMVTGGSARLPEVFITAAFMAGLLAIWPLVIWRYCKRRLLGVREAAYLQRDFGVGRSSSSDVDAVYDGRNSEGRP